MRPRRFPAQGDVIAGIIRQWDAENACDFAVPLDCDEFLTVFLDQLSLDPEVIRRQFDYLMQENATFITDRLLLNVPEAPDYYLPQIVRRGLFRAQTIVSLDRGFHNPQSIYPERYVRTPFVHLHLHNRPDYEEIRRFARQKLAASETGETLEHPQDGTHLHFYFETGSEDFAAGYRPVPNIYASVIAQRLRELGIDPDILLGTDNTIPHPPQHSIRLCRASGAGGRAAARIPGVRSGFLRREQPGCGAGCLLRDLAAHPLSDLRMG